jgi:macrodomain Ter protein organizer (MatP/YcbG family)
MTATTLGLRQCIGSRYRLEVPPIKRVTPQHTVAMDNYLWDRCLRIARIRRETLSEVIRRALVRYETRYRHLLAEE